jgi:hypothetical protein
MKKNWKMSLVRAMSSNPAAGQIMGSFPNMLGSSVGNPGGSLPAMGPGDIGIGWKAQGVGGVPGYTK